MTLINEELTAWAQRCFYSHGVMDYIWSSGVTGHFPDGPAPRPWVSIDECVTDKIAKVVGMAFSQPTYIGYGQILLGAKESEVAVMNSLTVNLHLLMVIYSPCLLLVTFKIPFYRPTSQRFKIIMEAKAFPSDFFAVKSQIELAG